jgi:TolB-like protein
VIDKTGKYEIVPPERVNGIFQRISMASFKTSLKDTLIKSGRELGADAVLYGYVYRFRERKGFAYGTDQAASVAFAMQLISARDGSLLWKGIFDKTQKSLMENVFQVFSFYKERGRWVTARELTEEGVLEFVKTFPGGQ